MVKIWLIRLIYQIYQIFPSIDVLRKLLTDGFPQNNYFELCAYYLLDFETIMKNNTIRDKPLKDLIEESLVKESKDVNKIIINNPNNNPNNNANNNVKSNNPNNPNEPMENKIKSVNASTVVPKARVIIIYTTYILTYLQTYNL